MTARKKSDAETVEGTAVPEPAAADVAVHAGDPNGIYRVLDRHDEQLVEAEIKGDLLATMAYEFSVGGKPVRGLSYAGVNSAVRVMNARGVAKITCPPFPEPKFEEVTDEEGDAAWRCTVYAVDELAGGGGWGTAAQKKSMKLRSGESRPDTFARTKALSKAQRNAKAALVPEGLKAQMLRALTGGQVRQVAAGPPAEPSKPLPLDKSPEARKVDADCKGMLAELKTHGLNAAKRKALTEAAGAARTLEQKRQVQANLQKALAAAQANAARSGR